MARFVPVDADVYINPDHVAMIRGGSPTQTVIVFTNGGSEFVAHPVDEVLAVLTSSVTP